MHFVLYTLTQRERDHFRKLLSERDTHVEDHRGTGQGGLTSVADLQAKLADKKCQLRNLADECQKWKEKAEQAEAQVHNYATSDTLHLPSFMKPLYFYSLWCIVI